MFYNETLKPSLEFFQIRITDVVLRQWEQNWTGIGRLQLQSFPSTSYHGSVATSKYRHAPNLPFLLHKTAQMASSLRFLYNSCFTMMKAFESKHKNK